MEVNKAAFASGEDIQKWGVSEKKEALQTLNCKINELKQEGDDHGIKGDIRELRRQIKKIKGERW